MEAFAKELHAKYIFCTDCSTTFERDMLRKLVDNLEQNPRTTVRARPRGRLSALGGCRSQGVLYGAFV
jgi:hypothetical protein